MIICSTSIKIQQKLQQGCDSCSKSTNAVCATQGDQIGQNFAYWAIVSFGQGFRKIRQSTDFWATLPHGEGEVLTVTNNGLGYILGDFFTNSSGHPDATTCAARRYLFEERFTITNHIATYIDKRTIQIAIYKKHSQLQCTYVGTCHKYK
jgi:hypothetical protein